MRQLTNGINGLGDLAVPHARMRRTLVLSVPNSTWTQLDMNDEVERSGIGKSGWSLLIEMPGLYRIDAAAMMMPGPLGNRALRVRAGADVVLQQLGSAATTALSQGLAASDTVRLAAGTVVSMDLLQTTGGTLDVNVTTPLSNRITVTWAGA